MTSRPPPPASAKDYDSRHALGACDAMRERGPEEGVQRYAGRKTRSYNNEGAGGQFRTTSSPDTDDVSDRFTVPVTLFPPSKYAFPLLAHSNTRSAREALTFVKSMRNAQNVHS